jgi:DNA-binding XRE family transcriptional regulator
MNRDLLVELMEECRSKLKLRAEDMASILGVSRISYYKWRKGGTMRPTTVKGVEATLRKIAHVMREHKWPTGPEMAMPAERRADRLRSLMTFYP